HAVVTDFGVALVAHQVGAERVTTGGMSPGTPEYMSPEQAHASSHIDARSDIYSLGCLVYEMLVGEPPFAGTSPRAILARKLMEPPRGLRVVRPTIAPAVEQVVLKALATIPADRYRTAAEFAEALDRAVLETPSAVAPGSVVAIPTTRPMSNGLV